MKERAQAAKPAVLVLGPPGAGKTTLALGLCARFPELGHLAPRRFLLAERRRGTALGRAAFAFLERRTLLPEHFFVDVALDLARQGRFDAGMVFEGLPVTVSQAELLWEAVLAEPSLRVLALVLDVPERIMQARVGARLSCSSCECAGRVPPARSIEDRCPVCGAQMERRAEDSPERLAARFREQHREIDAVLGWLAGSATVVRLDGELPAEEILGKAERLVTAIVTGRAPVDKALR